MLDLQLPMLAQATNVGVEPRTTPVPVAPAPAPTEGAPVSVAPGGTPIATSQGAPKEQGGMFSGLMGILPIVLMLGVLYVVLIRGQKKEEKKKKAMMSELKKGDKVMTIGGLIARVVSVDGDEVVLKVDESNNVKETYTLSAIQKVLTPGGDDKK